MKFLILFVVGALFGSALCEDQECFRAVFKECVKQTPPGKQMALCDEVKFQIECVAQKADKCNMKFNELAERVQYAVQMVCGGGDTQKLFEEEKACYKTAVEDSQCAGPINEVMKDRKTSEEIIKSNKKVCKLFGPYSKCVEKKAEKSCSGTSDVLFNTLYDPLYDLADALCQQLILPADEKDGRPDNFGVLNAFMVVKAFFGYV